jgi:hypothetical protein
MEVYRTFNHFLKYPPRFNSKRASRAGIAGRPIRNKAAAYSVAGLAFTLLGREQPDGSDRGVGPCLLLDREDSSEAVSAR